MRTLLNLFGIRRRRLEQDLDKELRYHLDRRTADLAGSGLSAAEARRQALIEFGGVARVQEEVRDTWVARWFHDLARDFQQNGRALRKSAGFTTVAVLSLAIGIGASAAIFGVFYAVVVRPLPYRNPNRLISLAIVSKGAAGGFVLTPEFVAWRASARSFEVMTAWNDEQFNLTGTGNPERIVGASVTADFLPVLGVLPAAGRAFTEADDAPASGAVALISYPLWRRQFRADPAVLGKAIRLNEKLCTVVGILPSGFRFPGNLDPEILVTSRLTRQPDWAAESVGLLSVAGRLREGVSVRQAAAELSAIGARYEAAMPAWLKEQRKGSTTTAVPLQQHLVGDTRPALMVLLGAVGLLLAIGCVNVTNLQLGRSTARRREIVLRTALGASRARIARSLLIENLMLGGLSGMLGILIAAGLLSVLQLFFGVLLRDAKSLQVSWILGGTAFLLATLCGLAIGLVPALTSPVVDLNEALKTGARSLVTGKGSLLRSTLVSAQVALSLILLLGAGLLLRSLRNVLVVDPGFDSRGVITARINLPESRYPLNPQQAAFSKSLVERVTAIPGVVAAGTTNSLPLTGYSMGAAVAIEGRPELPPQERSVPVLIVSPGYFDAIGMHVVSGRPFNNRDRATGLPVAIANQKFAQRFFSSQDVVGKHVRLGPKDGWATIVGVVRDVRHAGRERNSQPELFVPVAKDPSRRVNLAIRTSADPAKLAASIRQAVWELDKDLPVFDVATMDDRLWRSGETRTAQTLLLVMFASLALCLAAVGVYGVVSEAVQQRTGEIGLRMALGADGRDVRRMVMRRSFALAASGIAAGALASLAVVRYLASLLYGVKPTDTATFAAVGCVLLIVTLIAGYVPARRASRIDPLVALRCE